MVSWVEGVGGRPLCAILPHGVMQFLCGGQLTAIDSLRGVNNPLLFSFRAKAEKQRGCKPFSC